MPRITHIKPTQADVDQCDPRWPKYRMARDLAGSVFPTSEAVILQTARKNNIGRKMRRSVIFSPEDCQHLYEILPCFSASFADRNRRKTSPCRCGRFASAARTLGCSGTPRGSLFLVRRPSLGSTGKVTWLRFRSISRQSSHNASPMRAPV